MRTSSDQPKNQVCLDFSEDFRGYTSRGRQQQARPQNVIVVEFTTSHAAICTEVNGDELFVVNEAVLQCVREMVHHLNDL